MSLEDDVRLRYSCAGRSEELQRKVMLAGFSNALTSELVDDGGSHLARLYEGSNAYSSKLGA